MKISDTEITNLTMQDKKDIVMALGFFYNYSEKHIIQTIASQQAVERIGTKWLNCCDVWDSPSWVHKGGKYNGQKE